MNEAEIRGERQLFKAVIDRAVRDAFSTAGEPQAITKLDREQAQYFLCEDKHCFYQVCELAGVSGDRIRKGALKLRAMKPSEASALYRKLWRDDK